MIRIEVTKNQNESNAGVMRRFTKKMQGSGILKKVRRGRFHKRAVSDFIQKKSALHRLNKRAEIEKQKKLGKIKDVYYKGRR